MNFEFMQEMYRAYAGNIIASLVIIIIYIVARRYTRPKIEESVQQSRLNDESYKIARNSVNAILGTILIALICIVWGLDFRGLLFLSTGILTITGVALFANWSLISNITAFLILLMHSSYRRGNFLRVFDADNYIEGYISEINLFNTKMLTEDREIIIYPNNLLISRPTMINPRNRFSVVGKTGDLSDEKKISNSDDN
jgi:small-conductance mechanosensitive channel